MNYLRRIRSSKREERMKNQRKILKRQQKKSVLVMINSQVMKIMLIKIIKKTKMMRIVMSSIHSYLKLRDTDLALNNQITFLEVLPKSSSSVRPRK